MDSFFITLAERASLPEERGSYPFVLPSDPESTAVAVDRTRRWKNAVAKGNEAVFHAVQSWRRIDPDAYAKALGPARLIPGAVLPAWVVAFRAIVEPLISRDDGAMFDPFLRAGIDRLPAGWDEGLSEDARLSLTGRLEGLLTSLCRSAVLSESPAGVRRWSELSGGVLGFFGRYPVLARLMTGLVETWAEATLEFVTRLAADRPLISERLLGGREPGDVRTVSMENADPHDGGRSVMVLTFVSGDRIVYKPRSLAIDVSLSVLLDWLRETGGFDVRLPVAIDRDGYGWAEFITHTQAEDEQDVALFYRRGGVLLALAYVLDASDLHYENIIAAGSYPVPIDLETMLRPQMSGRVVSPDFVSPVDRAAWTLGSGILQTCLVPNRLALAPGTTVDLGGLSDPGMPGWNQFNRPNRDFIESVLARHGEMIVAGFTEGYRRLQALRDELLADGGPIAALTEQPLRAIFRDTQIYLRLILGSLTPKALADGAERDLALESVARVLCLCDHDNGLASLVGAEKRALINLDIPRFSVAVGSRDLRCRGESIGVDLITAPALEGVRHRLGLLSDDDRRTQEVILRLALQARIVCRPERLGVIQPAPGVASPSCAREGMADASDRLGGIVKAAALERNDHGMAWFSLRRVAKEGYFSLVGGDCSLGYGNAGIGLFFAALHVARPGRGWDDLARASFRPILDALDAPPFLAERYRTVRRDGSFGSGLAGMAYAMARAGALLGDSELLAESRTTAARAAAANKDVSAIDLHDGLSGAIIALLTVSRLTDTPELGNTAAAIGRRLVAQADGKTLSSLRPSGLLQGPAGVALAATRLFAYDRDNAWRSLADAALAAENAVTDPGYDWASGLAGRDVVNREAALVFRQPVAGADPMATLSAALLAEAGASLAWGMAGLLERGDVPDCLSDPDQAEKQFYFFPPMPGVVSVGLFHGIAGAGYQLLRRSIDGIPSIAVFS